MASARTATSRLADAAGLLVEAYLDELVALDPRVARAPCFAFGRGGIAYTLLKAGTLRGDRALVQAARRWATSGIRLGRRFHVRGWPKASFSRGLTGLHAIAALAAHADGDDAACRREIGQFVTYARRGRGTIELFGGMAGRLAGAAIVERAVPDPRVRALGDTLAPRLLASLVPDAGARAPREAPPTTLAAHGLAHGRPGVLAALLAWHEVSRSLPEAALRRAVDAVHAGAVAAAAQQGIGPWERAPAGMALVFARAHLLLGDARFLTWMREAAARARAIASRSARLGDGFAGVAYAQFAAAGADPSGPWRDAACEAAAQAFARVEVTDDPYGMFSGLGGVCCLALDLLHGTEARFPGVEA